MRGLLILCVLFVIPNTTWAIDIGHSYLSCRCCCSSDVDQAETMCLYHAQKPSMAQVIHEDEIWKKSPEAKCEHYECVAARLYKYCD